MAPGLFDVRPEGRYLDPLVSLRVGVGLIGQRRPAIFTLGRIEVDDIIDLVCGNEFAPRAAVTALAAARPPALAALAAAAVPGGPWWVARRRPVRVSRILSQPLRQLRHLLRQRRDLPE
jgi:hypothetical protein